MLRHCQQHLGHYVRLVSLINNLMAGQFSETNPSMIKQGYTVFKQGIETKRNKLCTENEY